MATDTPSRLLAMLNSASSSSSSRPSTSSQTPTTSAPHSRQTTHPQHNPDQAPGIPSSTSSPREPTPAPPGPSLQSVSLHDLFKNLSPPPPTRVGKDSQGQVEAGITKVGSREDQQNKLLGMLQGLGVPAPASNGQASRVISPPASGVPTPGPQQLLNMLKSSAQGPPTANSQSSQPVIEHPTSPVKSFSETQNIQSPSISQPSPPNAPSASTSIQQAPITPNKGSETAQLPPTEDVRASVKSPFTFISPFDAFEAPKPRGTPQKPKEVKKAADTVAVKAQDTVDKKPTQEELSQADASYSSPDGVKRKVMNASQQPPATMETASAVQGVASPENASSGKVGTKTDSDSVYDVRKINQGANGNGPKLVDNSAIIIDLSKPNLESLITEKNAIQSNPIMMKRTDKLSFQRGRSVGITKNWMAYTLPSRRVRLIDRNSGGRLALQLSGDPTGILDLAVTATLIAVVSDQGHVDVWRVPESWEVDDPPCQHVLSLLSPPDSPIGSVQLVEWLAKSTSAESQLAVAGDGGVMLVPVQSLGRDIISIMEVVELGHRVLTTDGPLAAFCFNQTQQAIGLLSQTSHFTLYSTANLSRAFHKQLPASSETSTPSSVRFVETQVLVGRNDNSIFDLVQIAASVALLSSIKIAAPSPSGTLSNYSHSVYDAERTTLWIAPIQRGSLFGFKYDLKGKGAFKVKDGETVKAWSKMVEVPLAPVTSMTLAPPNEIQEVEIMFAHPGGVSMAVIGESVLAEMTKPTLLQETPAPAASGAPKLLAVEGKPSAVVPEKLEKAEKVPEKPDSPVIKQKEKVLPPKAAPKSSPKVAQKSVASDPDDEPVVVEKTEKDSDSSAKQLKKMEDRIITQMRQALSSQMGGLEKKVEGINTDKIVNEITTKVERQVKANLTNVIRDEIKKSLVPQINTLLQNELRAATSSHIPTSISETLKQVVPTELERILPSLVQQSANKMVSQALDRSLQDSLQRIVLPAVTQATGKMFDGLAKDLKSEMLQLRKDLSPVQSDNETTVIMRQMSTQMAELQRQVAGLSEQTRAPPSHPLPPPPMAHPHPPPMQQIPQPIPVGPPPPSAQQLEDTFLNALQSPTNPQTFQLLKDLYVWTDSILPLAPSRPPPLSQAVMLTLLHRLSMTLADVNPLDPMFGRITNWLYRDVMLLDQRDESLRDYMPKVMDVVKALLLSVVQRLGNDQARSVREILDVVNQKS